MEKKQRETITKAGIVIIFIVSLFLINEVLQLFPTYADNIVFKISRTADYNTVLLFIETENNTHPADIIFTI